MRIEAGHKLASYESYRAAALVFTAAVATCACGGGGGDSPAGGTQRLAQELRGQTFRSASATYRISASSQIDYSVLRDRDDPSARGVRVETSTSGDSIVISVNETLDSGLSVADSQTLSLPPPGSTVSGVPFLQDGNHFDYPAENSNLSYLSFAEWFHRLDITRTGSLFAFGHGTPLMDIPIAGTATYNGSFQGTAIEGLTKQGISGSLTLQVNFVTGSISIDTTNQFDPSYNLIGLLGYAAGSTTISGTLHTAFVAGPGEGYSGNAVAHFFGPNAEELGGAFRLSRVRIFCFPTCFAQEHIYMASFGVKR